MSAGVQQAPVPFTPSPSQVAVAYSVCRHITRSSAKNFYYAFLVLPKRKRRALCAVYALMRRCDDIADDPNLPLQERRNKLADVVQNLHRAQAGWPTDDAVLLAVTDAQRRFKISSDLLDQLAYGTMMDLEEAAEGVSPSGTPAAMLSAPYRTFDDLYKYCYRVASVVGLVCICIFGYRDRRAEGLAERCGLAFQLTNIIRDVKEDAQMGRVYLPQEDLAAIGVNAAELRNARDGGRFRQLLALEADRARDFYRAGDELIPLVNEDSQPALWVLITIYRRLLEKIARQQYEVFGGKITLSRREKLFVLAQGFLKRLA
ncbi:MAG TPA: phytoene/squalene synthase family protein [Terriglobales bacterium]|nr:phytoene/squalene synthase family protein [Terriglobales bacterium]